MTKKVNNDTINENTKEELNESVDNILELSEEEKAKNEEAYNKAMDWLKNLKLRWTFKSIEYMLEEEEITLNQLRACVFKNKVGEVVYNIEKAVELIIVAGLVNEIDDYRKRFERANEIMEEWREKFGFIGVMQVLLINIMEEKHFFMDTGDMQILQHLASKNLQNDTILNLISTDIQTKTAQTEALS